MKKAFLSLLILLAVTACKSRNEADAILRNMCVAGIEHILPSDMTYKGLNQVTYEDAEEIKGTFRRVNITADLNESGFTETRDFECVFNDRHTMFGLQYSPEIHYIEGEDVVIGYRNGIMVGSSQDYVDLIAVTSGAK